MCGPQNSLRKKNHWKKTLHWKGTQNGNEYRISVSLVFLFILNELLTKYSVILLNKATANKKKARYCWEVPKKNRTIVKEYFLLPELLKNTNN